MKTTKKIDYLGIAILLTVILTTSILSFQLSKIRTDLKVQSIAKIQVTNNDQLKKLCTQFSEQWHADNYAIYIYQPNSPVKTHKELAAASLSALPLRLQLTDYRELNQNKIDFGSTTGLVNFKEYEIGKAYVRIPIYQYSVIVSELYLFYDEQSSVDSSIFDQMIVESQIINQLLK